MIPLYDNIRHAQMLRPDKGMNWAFVPGDLLSIKAIEQRGFPAVYGGLFLSMFMHGGLLHIGGNMLFLWVFGDNVEDRLGHAKYLGFYLLCGIIAGLCHALYTYFKLLIFGIPVGHPPEAAIPTVGASGSVAGVLGAYIRLFPGALVRSLVFLFFFAFFADLPAFLFIGIWFLMQALGGYTALFSSFGGGVAVWAHIGGFVAGYIMVRLMLPRRRPPRRPRYNLRVLD